MKVKYILICVASVIILSSCENGLVHDTVYNNSRLFHDANVRRVIPTNRTFYGQPVFTFYSDETYFSQVNAIDELEVLIKKHPNKTKYSNALEKYKNQLYGEYRKRVNDRMVFLREFYTDMYKLSNKDFSKKYRRHCHKELLAGINNVQPKQLDVDGDHWYVFTDLVSHESDDYTFTYMNGDPRKVNNQKIAMYIYEDSVNVSSIYQYKKKYRLYNKEDKWYKVSMGNHSVMVKVEEQKKHCKITGLVNLAIPFAYMNERQIQKGAWESVLLKIGEGMVIKHVGDNP